VESSCECGNEPSVPLNTGKVSRGLTAGGLSSSAQLQKVSSIAVQIIVAARSKA
jgi:hypothetical protein